ncbi:MAG: hypothetical protein IJZ10_03245, partial [Thermoguttaceae bacterium]|nr:hypothetical protein [Thermoguttaceae bacterium]
METRKRRREVAVWRRRERGRGEIERRRETARGSGLNGDLGDANAKIVEVERVGSERFERNRRAVRRFGEVESGAKMLAGAAQDDETRLIVGGDSAKFGEKTAQQVEGKRVATVRAIQRHRRDAAFVVDSRQRSGGIGGIGGFMLIVKDGNWNGAGLAKLGGTSTGSGAAVGGVGGESGVGDASKV